MRVYVYLLMIVLPILACSQSTSKSITEFSQDDIGNGILIDVRTPKEYSAGHLDNAVNIDWFAKDFATRVDTIARDRPVFLYCKMGGRSAKAAQMLDSLGFSKVVNLEGGYDAVIEE